MANVEKQQAKAIARYNDYLVQLGIAGATPFDFKKKQANIGATMGYMLGKTVRMFEYEGLPETIPARILEQMLQAYGYIGIGKHNGELYAYYGGLGGEPDVYYRPTLFVVANPAQNFSAEWVIDEEVALIFNDPYLQGMLPMYNKYATLLTENEITLRMALINARMQKALVAPDSNTYKSMCAYIDKLLEGDLAVISDNPLISESKSLLPAENTSYLINTTQVLQYLKASWYNEIGLDDNWNMKRESVYSAEAEMNQGSLMALVDAMLKEREEGLERVNALWGTDITVRLAHLWEHNHAKAVVEIPTAEGTENGENSGASGENPVERDTVPSPGSGDGPSSSRGGSDGADLGSADPFPGEAVGESGADGSGAGDGEVEPTPAIAVTINIADAESISIDAPSDPDPNRPEEGNPDETD